MSIARYSFIQLSELEQSRVKNLPTASQDSKPGYLSREYEPLPLSHCALQSTGYFAFASWFHTHFVICYFVRVRCPVVYSSRVNTWIFYNKMLRSILMLTDGCRECYLGDTKPQLHPDARRSFSCRLDRLRTSRVTWGEDRSITYFRLPAHIQND